VKSVPRGEAIWNVNGGFVSVLLTHLFRVFVYLAAAIAGKVSVFSHLCSSATMFVCGLATLWANVYCCCREVFRTDSCRSC